MNGKFLTKLLNADYRRCVIGSMSENKLQKLKIDDYSKYVLNEFVGGRNAAYKDDRSSFYGYAPIDVIAYVNNKGEVVSKLFEFKTIISFLRMSDAISAREVITAILVKLAQETPDIKDFDVETIKTAMKELEGKADGDVE